MIMLHVTAPRTFSACAQVACSSIFSSINEANVLLDDGLRRPRGGAAARHVVGSAEAAVSAVASSSSCTLRPSVVALGVMERSVSPVSASTGDHRLSPRRPSTSATAGGAGDRWDGSGEL